VNYPPGWMPASGIGSQLSTTRSATPATRSPAAWPCAPKLAATLVP